MVEVATQVNLEDPPVRPPEGCDDPFLWELARTYNDNHIADAAGRCQECWAEYPCLGRMLARDGLMTALGQTVDQSAYWRELARIRRREQDRHAGA